MERWHSSTQDFSSPLSSSHRRWSAMVYKLRSIYSSSSLRKSSLSDVKTGTIQFFDLLQISNAASALAFVLSLPTSKLRLFYEKSLFPHEIFCEDHGLYSFLASLSILLFNFSMESVAFSTIVGKVSLFFSFCGKSVGDHSRSVFAWGRVELIKTFSFSLWLTMYATADTSK